MIVNLLVIIFLLTSASDAYVGITSRLRPPSLLSSRLIGGEHDDLVITKSHPGAWFPVGTTKSMPDDFPFSIMIANKPLVVFKSHTPSLSNMNSKGWSVFLDQCPHRAAPLSQGRIDEKGNLECPYHGWSFNSNGECQNIPQLEDKKKCNNKANSATSLPTLLTGEMLWAFVTLPEGETSFNEHPQHIYPELNEIEGWTTRNLPYSLDFLIENFMDPGKHDHYYCLVKMSPNETVNLLMGTTTSRILLYN
jgi:nitrite reductase/ring-hydroxylating ferredoxin subunit